MRPMSKGKHKTLCKWSKDDGVEKDLKKIAKVVTKPTLICRKCARVANCEDYLCKPLALPES